MKTQIPLFTTLAHDSNQTTIVAEAILPHHPSMCHNLHKMHKLCPHAISAETIPCFTFLLLGRCLANITGGKIQKVKGDIPYCHVCYTRRPEVSIWLAIAEAEFRRDMKSKVSSEERLEKEVSVWKRVITGKLIGLATEGPVCVGESRMFDKECGLPPYSMSEK